MEKKKVFIISFNQLTTDFWKHHLNLENAQLWHWKNSELAINNFKTVWPDVIIVDGYFAKQSYSSCLQNILKLRSNQKIFCLTPLSKVIDNKVLIDERLSVSKLDQEVVNQINSAINSNQEIIQFKKIA